MTERATSASSLELSLAPTAAAAGEVRARLRELVLGTPFAARLDDVQIAATELVTNAVLHGREPITVRLSVDDERLRVEVHDASPVSPTFSMLDPTAVTGRGLMLVSSLVDHWGVEPQPDGKCVWAELSSTVPAPSDEADVAALLASWRDDLVVDPADERVRVVLTDLDTARLAAVETHAEGLLRELALLVGSGEAAPRLTQTASQVLQAVERFDASRAELKRQLAAAVARRQPVVDIELAITRSDAELVRDYGHALEAADRLCATGELLHEPLPEDLVDLRRAYLRRVLAQLGS